MAELQNGVNISLREIYDTLQEVKNEVKGISSKMNQVEDDAIKGVEALQIAREAHALATKHEDGFKWLWRSIAAAFITGIISAIIAFMVLSIQLGIRSQVTTINNPSTNAQQEMSSGHNSK